MYRCFRLSFLFACGILRIANLPPCALQHVLLPCNLVLKSSHLTLGGFETFSQVFVLVSIPLSLVLQFFEAPYSMVMGQLMSEDRPKKQALADCSQDCFQMMVMCYLQYLWS